MQAEYLFQQDKHYELSLDTGDKTIQCGRHIDILKLWLAWKARGHQGYAEHIEVLLERATFLYETVKAREPYFRMVMKVNERNEWIEHIVSNLAAVHQRLFLVRSSKFTSDGSDNIGIQRTVGWSKSLPLISLTRRLFDLLEGCASNQRTHDELRHDDGRLSTFGWISELLSCYHLQSCNNERRHRFDDWWNSWTGKWPLNNPLCIFSSFSRHYSIFIERT